MGILYERKSWRKARPPTETRRSSDLTPDEQANVRRALAVLVRRLGSRKALALARPMMPGRSVEPLLSEWETLAGKTPFNRRVRLLPMLRFLSGRDIGPDGVTLADLHAFRDAIAADRQLRSVVAQLRGDSNFGALFSDPRTIVTTGLDAESIARARASIGVREVHVRSLVAGSGPTGGFRGLLERRGDAWTIVASEGLRRVLG